MRTTWLCSWRLKPSRIVMALSAVSIARFRQAKTALGACFEELGDGGGVMMDANDRKAIEQILALHDKQLLAVSSHRYLDPQERAKQLAQAGRSAIPDQV
ncbi:hypothetical protein DF052_27140 [Burkholderia glumae]|nr:hypothetical protein HJC54_09875 [Burkholderia glumae]QJW80480.1 hypothetical protein GAS18_16985 [Burkholderia glumae]RQZ64993.1 hypothetical protein DF052_27140 [Burkholderia glumae]